MLKAPLNRPGQVLRDLMKRGTVTAPGVFSPFSALAAQEAGAQALYLTGAGVTNGLLGVPDIALITQNEMVDTAAKVCQVVQLPVIADADTGYGETQNVFRCVIELERAGLAGIHLEDQVNPKRCGHLDGKEVVSTEHMATKIRAAVDAKRDASFIVCARTDARGVEGLEAAIERAKRYVDAGADMVFPEGLTSIEEFLAFRQAISVPMLANMTEFGKTPLIPVSEFAELGYELVIFPMTAFRMMHAALAETYRALVEEGTQAGLMDKMNTRAELYATLGYADYETADRRWSRG